MLLHTIFKLVEACKNIEPGMFHIYFMIDCTMQYALAHSMDEKITTMSTDFLTYDRSAMEIGTCLHTALCLSEW